MDHDGDDEPDDSESTATTSRPPDPDQVLEQHGESPEREGNSGGDQTNGDVDEDEDNEGDSTQADSSDKDNKPVPDSAISSLTGFLFGNVDEHGHLEEDFLDEVGI